ncbi:MAG: hypothetical protein AB1578_22775 [Thermodesulfobacteriota bacterium]
MTDHEKALAYYKTAAIQARPGSRPPFVPSRVRVPETVRGDGPFAGTRVLPGEHDCRSNRLGAVSVLATNGQWLGLRLDEFEPIAWRENPKV